MNETEQADLEYDLHVLRASSSKHYFQFCRLFFLIFDGDHVPDPDTKPGKNRDKGGNKRLNALFLQDLIDSTQQERAIREVVDGKLWHLCTVNYLANSVSAWTAREQDRRLYDLRRYGYVETMRRGKDAARWVHINAKRINRKIDAVIKFRSLPNGSDLNGRSLPNGSDRSLPFGSGNNNQGKRTNRGDRRAAARPSSPTPPIPPLLNGHSRIPKTSPYHQSAVKLREALRRNNRVAAGALVNWPDHFRLLAEVDGQDYAAVLDWYCEHCGREDQKEFGLPSISSAKQFRARYDWIEEKANKAGVADRARYQTEDLGNGRTRTYIANPNNGEVWE